MEAYGGFLRGPFLSEGELTQSIPRMRSWEDFVAATAGRSSPLRHQLHQLPDWLKKGIRLRASFSAEDAIRYRADMLQRISRLVANDGPSTTPRWGLLQRLGEVVGHGDSSFLQDSASPDGFRLLGQLPPHAGWAPKREQELYLSPDSHSATAEELVAKHAAERHRGYFRLPDKHVNTFYKMLKDQTQKGYWQEFSISEAESELGGFAAWLFFAVEEEASDGTQKSGAA